MPASLARAAPWRKAKTEGVEHADPKTEGVNLAGRFQPGARQRALLVEGGGAAGARLVVGGAGGGARFREGPYHPEPRARANLGRSLAHWLDIGLPFPVFTRHHLPAHISASRQRSRTRRSALSVSRAESKKMYSGPCLG